MAWFFFLVYFEDTSRKFATPVLTPPPFGSGTGSANLCVLQRLERNTMWRKYKSNWCKYEGCTRQRCSKALTKGMCCTHGKLLANIFKGVVDEFPFQFARVKRTRDLYQKHIDELRALQKDMCADPLGRCPIGQNPVPRDMMEVDHKIPIFEGGTNCITNLQAVCACCHRAKSNSEHARRKSA